MVLVCTKKGRKIKAPTFKFMNGLLIKAQSKPSLYKQGKKKVKLEVHERYFSLKKYCVHQVFFSNKMHCGYRFLLCYPKQMIFLCCSNPTLLSDATVGFK